MMRYLIVLVGLMAVISCKQATQDLSQTTQELYGNAIGTTYSIKYFSNSANDLEPQVDSLIDLFNQSMSTWVPDSKINQINAGKDSVAVGAAFKEVFDYAAEIYRKTDGYFDPTVGNLVNAYGFGADGKQEKIPSQQIIDSLRQYVGFYKLDMIPAGEEDRYFVMGSHSGIYLEFNAIAKGTLVDYIARMLANQGITNYLVEVGGEVVAAGMNIERQKEWSIGVADPTQDRDGLNYVTAVKLKNKAMAGSGNFRKFKIDQVTGNKIVHTVNPLTGIAVPSEVLGVNVIADNCTLADGYATAFMAMPLEKSRRLLTNLPEIDVLIMYMGKDGKLKFETTPGFNDYVKDPIL